MTTATDDVEREDGAREDDGDDAGATARDGDDGDARDRDVARPAYEDAYADAVAALERAMARRARATLEANESNRRRNGRGED